ncbi:hypothetical protein Y032_0002g993 [Ancylostoma ceylanicum]|uniref:Uncharacterized protein n=1 Tax=Ancylostoma ceylanicum TaxID=53326 RepID=A0A016W3B3_9BILA|nr:hypothetical protein Y032_0002g993 [Ancylostoma ceylanicum]
MEAVETRSNNPEVNNTRPKRNVTTDYVTLIANISDLLSLNGTFSLSSALCVVKGSTSRNPRLGAEVWVVK